MESRDAAPVIKTEFSHPTEINEPSNDSGIDSTELLMQHFMLHKMSFALLEESLNSESPRSLFEWINGYFGTDVLSELVAVAEEREITSSELREVTGWGLHALSDLYIGRLNPESDEYMCNIIDLGHTQDGTISLGFAGDVSFADDWRIMPKLDSRGEGITGIMDQRLIDIMKTVDIMCANNEFTLSERGQPLPRKAFTFRGHPSRVELWHDMGVDIVTLANNHVYDYGEDAFLDTLETLDNAGIARIGAGRNIEEACRPVYYIINGFKIAYVAATRAEKNIFTPEAGENSSGVLRTYDSELFCSVIEKAKKESDYVIVNVHWGAENSTRVEDVLFEMSRQYIDSGADLVVGHHAHVLQGMDSYNGKIIAYNLGNLIFNSYSVPTGILVASIDADGEISGEFIPAYQQNCYTRLSAGEEYEEILRHLRSISFDVEISENGAVIPKK